MGSKTDVFENKLSDFLWRGQTLTLGTSTATWSAAAPKIWVGLFTAQPTDSTSGTEVIAGGNSYARQNICGSDVVPSLTNVRGTHGTASGASSGTGGTISNENVLTWTNFPGVSVTGFGLFDASTTGNLLEYAALTGGTVAVPAGSTVTFAAGALTVQEDN
jgi:hypothetical protein